VCNNVHSSVSCEKLVCSNVHSSQCSTTYLKAHKPSHSPKHSLHHLPLYSNVHISHHCAVPFCLNTLIPLHTAALAPSQAQSTSSSALQQCAMAHFPPLCCAILPQSPQPFAHGSPSHPPKHSLQALIHNLVLMQHAHLVRYITCVLERPHHMPHSHRVCYLTRVFKRPYHAACAPSALSYPCVRTATPYAALPPCMF